MKKTIITIALFLTLVIPFTVNAGIKNSTSCENATIDETGKPISVCYIDIEVTDTTRLYKIDGKLNFNNSSFKTIETVDSRIKITNSNPDNLVFEFNDSIKNEKVRIAKITIYINTTGEQCNVTWQPTQYGINYSCEKVGDKYYDLKGNLTDYTNYDKECNHYCEHFNNQYYGKSGNIVDEKTYDKECNKHICQIIDSTFYDNSGNIVTEKEYNKKCGKYSCVIVDNEYYNSEGNVVAEKEYKKDCGKYSCVIVDDEYYDETGKIVDKTTWETLCTIPENPTTGSSSVIYIAVIGVIALISIGFIIKKSTKIYKI